MLVEEISKGEATTMCTNKSTENLVDVHNYTDTSIAADAARTIGAID